MSVFLVQRGLTIKIGERRLAFHRMLDDKKVQFEDVLSGTYKTFQLAELQKSVMAGTYVVLGENSAEPHKFANMAEKGSAAFIVSNLDEKNKKEWDRRLGYVLGMRKRGVPRASRMQIGRYIPDIAEKLGDKNSPSPSTVIEWMKRYEQSGHNTVSLVPGHVLRSSSRRVPQEVLDKAWKYLRKYYFRREGHGLAETGRRLNADIKKNQDLHGEGRLEEISNTTLWRMAQSVSAYERDRARMGPASANAKWRHSTGGSYATRPLERVELDHTELDIYVIDERRGIPLGRPVLTVMRDVFSGYILAIYLSFEGESLGRVSRIIKFALMPKEDITKSIPTHNEWVTMGLWECLVMDNAIAHHSPQMKSIALALGCELEYSPVRKPWFKAGVERAMLECARILPIEGKTTKLRGIVDVYDPIARACMTFSDLAECLTKWVVDVYPYEISERTLDRPIDKLKSGLDAAPPPVVCSGLESLDIITGLSKEVTVNQGGVEFLYLSYRSPELAEMVKRQRSPRFKAAMKFDPNDLGAVWVQDPTENTWITVPCLQYEYANGLSRTQHKLIRQNIKGELRRSGAYETLMQAQAELRERFDDAILRGRSKKRANKQYALLAGLSSFAVGAERSEAQKALPQQVITEEEMSVGSRKTPMFTPVNLRVSNGWEEL